MTNVCSVLAGENGAQLQVWRNIKTQLRADMELVMQKSEDRRRGSGVRGGKRRAQQRESDKKLRYLGSRQRNPDT